MDVAQHFRARPDQNTIADLRMPVLFFFARPAQRHRMQHRDIVAHHRGLTDDDGMGMVDHDPLPDPRRRVDIDPKGFAHPHLDEIGEILPPLAP